MAGSVAASSSAPSASSTSAVEAAKRLFAPLRPHASLPSSSSSPSSFAAAVERGRGDKKTQEPRAPEQGEEQQMDDAAQEEQVKTAAAAPSAAASSKHPSSSLPLNLPRARVSNIQSRLEALPGIKTSASALGLGSSLPESGSEARSALTPSAARGAGGGGGGTPIFRLPLPSFGGSGGSTAVSPINGSGPNLGGAGGGGSSTTNGGTKSAARDLPLPFSSSTSSTNAISPPNSTLPIPAAESPYRRNSTALPLPSTSSSSSNNARPASASPPIPLRRRTPPPMPGNKKRSLNADDEGDEADADGDAGAGSPAMESKRRRTDAREEPQQRSSASTIAAAASAAAASGHERQHESVRDRAREMNGNMDGGRDREDKEGGDREMMDAEEEEDREKKDEPERTYPGAAYTHRPAHGWEEEPLADVMARSGQSKAARELDRREPSPDHSVQRTSNSRKATGAGGTATQQHTSLPPITIEHHRSSSGTQHAADLGGERPHSASSSVASTSTLSSIARRRGDVAQAKVSRLSIDTGRSEGSRNAMAIGTAGPLMGPAGERGAAGGRHASRQEGEGRATIHVPRSAPPYRRNFAGTWEGEEFASPTGTASTIAQEAAAGSRIPSQHHRNPFAPGMRHAPTPASAMAAAAAAAAAAAPPGDTIGTPGLPPGSARMTALNSGGRYVGPIFPDATRPPPTPGSAMSLKHQQGLLRSPSSALMRGASSTSAGGGPAYTREPPPSAAASGPPPLTPATHQAHLMRVGQYYPAPPPSSSRSSLFHQQHPGGGGDHAAYHSPNASKQHFMSFFSDFYDSLVDSRALKATLEDQIDRSNALLHTLQSSSRFFEELLDQRLKEERFYWESVLEKMGARIEELERWKEVPSLPPPPPPPHMPRRSDPSTEQHPRSTSHPHTALPARPPQISRSTGVTPTPAEGETSRRLSPLTVRSTLPPPPPFHQQHGGPSRALHPPPPPPSAGAGSYLYHSSTAPARSHTYPESSSRGGPGPTALANSGMQQERQE